MAASELIQTGNFILQSNRIFFFSAKTQHENLGDAVINRELLRELTKAGRVEMCEGGMPGEFLAFVSVPGIHTHASTGAFYLLLLKTAIFALFKPRQQLYYVLNPGGFSGGVSGIGYLRQAFLIFMYMLLNLLCVRVVRLGASAGPYSTSRLRIEKLKTALMHKNTVRDTVSLDYLKQHGFPEAGLFPDWAYMLDKAGTDSGSPLFGSRGYSVVSFRAEPGKPGYDAAIERHLDALISEHPQLAQQQWACVSQVDFDVARNAQLAAHLAARGIDTVCQSDLREPEYFRIYRHAQYVFSNRLHVLLFALRQGAVAYAMVDPAINTKIVGIYRDMGLQELIIDITRPTTPHMLKTRASFEPEVDAIFQAKQAEIRKQLQLVLQGA